MTAAICRRDPFKLSPGISRTMGWVSMNIMTKITMRAKYLMELSTPPSSLVLFFFWSCDGRRKCTVYIPHMSIFFKPPPHLFLPLTDDHYTQKGTGKVNMTQTSTKHVQKFPISMSCAQYEPRVCWGYMYTNMFPSDEQPSAHLKRAWGALQLLFDRPTDVSCEKKIFWGWSPRRCGHRKQIIIGILITRSTRTMQFGAMYMGMQTSVWQCKCPFG